MSERFPSWCLGYPEEWTVRPGSDVRFYVSGAGADTYQAQLVRLLHGDESPDGPGFKELEIAGYGSQTHRLVEQVTHRGSYGRIPMQGSTSLLDSEVPCTLFAFVRPSGVRSRQVVVSVWDEAHGTGLALEIDDLRPCLRAGGEGTIATVVAEGELLPHTWYALTGTWEPERRSLTVTALPAVNSYSSRVGPTCAVVPAEATGTGPGSIAWPEVDLLLGALDAGDGRVVQGRLSGRIALPCLFTRALSEEEVKELARDGVQAALEEGPAAWWDLSLGIDTFRIEGGTATSPAGRLVNGPTRGVTAHNWDGSCYEWPHAPSLYGAVHFHEDDVDDAGWTEGVTVHLDDDLPSGVYALRVRAGAAEDHIPVFVGPRPGRHSDVALVLPTSSYLAYANEHDATQGSPGEAIAGTPTLHRLDLLLLEHPELGLSMYDVHSDGTGVSLSSRRRPIVGLRPRHRFRMPGTWQLPSDLYLVDWLHQRGEDVDVLTDEDLHRDGYDALAPYTTVITGTHPEYTSERMLDAYEQYVASGGNIMYLGGNGFYWVVTFHPEHPWLMELRRGENGVRAWTPEPGETCHSTTGEKGGLWKLRGRPPQKLFGTGFTAEGYGRSFSYERLPDGGDSEMSWVFNGVPANEPIGDFGLIRDGASGQETDRADITLGTPPHTYLLATAFNVTDYNKIAPEDIGWVGDGPGGTQHPNVRADLTLYHAPGGGSVFATSSIAWAGALSHHGYDNNVARITGNVLDRFKRGPRGGSR